MIRFYSDLKTAVINYTRRDDIEDVFDTFLDVVNPVIINSVKFAASSVQGSEVLPAGTQTFSLPARLLGVREINLYIEEDTRVKLTQVPPQAQRLRDTSGVPDTYAFVSTYVAETTSPASDYEILGPTARFSCPTDAEYTLHYTYIDEPAPLSADVISNPILAKYPTIYFYALLWQVYDYGMEEEKATYHRNQMFAAIDTMNLAERTKLRGPAPVARLRDDVV